MQTRQARGGHLLLTPTQVLAQKWNQTTKGGSIVKFPSASIIRSQTQTNMISSQNFP